MDYIKRIICVGMIAVVLTSMLVGKASASSIDDLVARIAALTAQVDGLIKQLTAIREEGTFLFNLRAGMRNSRDVQRLQTFLIERGYLGREYATGNFLSLTAGAVKQFQTTMGLPITGVFDEQTRNKVNGLLNAVKAAVSTTVDGNTILVKTATSTALAQGVFTTAEAPVSQVLTVGTYHIDPRPTYDVAAIEKATFDAVNGERQKNGLSALRWNDQLADVARAHSSDQAGDNIKITDPDVACLYPYIRHEGFVSGFRVGERLDSRNIPYAIAGENLIIFPMTEELIYRSAEVAPSCKEFSDIEGPAGETQDAAQARIQKSLLDRLSLMVGQQRLNWVNKQWKGVSELASESTMDWMNSPGHRHNILTPDFQEGAIGASIVNDYIIMTEVFSKSPVL
jgi:uncharacterized protein YkwD/outer membrane murein-binding lipoprotein Lpp